ncbi:amidohydrolase family protein [Sphingomonas sp. MMS24-J13]|uniref:amidohydrolase family protein n=1 Tax=Sphingomonas sp. MMS24-J13 TaxID=3238686 RepID=UPI00384CC067
MHVFGPFDRFPVAAAPAYALPDADRRRHAETLTALGFENALLIQPSPYGADQRAMLDTIERSGGRFRGIGSCDPTASLEALQDLRDRGIVGLRFVAMTGPGGGSYPGTQGLNSWTSLRARMADARLHAQLWADAATCAKAAQEAAARGATLVLDHLAGLGPDDRPGTWSFDRIADAVAGDHVWIKLTWFRRSRCGGDYGDMEAVVRALAERAPTRILWGSDWPFVRVGQVPEPATLIEQLHSWLGSDGFVRCLRDNPRMLLGSGGDALDDSTVDQ